MVVDDDSATTDALTRMVEAMGHRVFACNSWTEALRVFGSSTIDLVLMDAVMPSVDGFKLTRILRSRASTYVPLLFLTGLADHRSRKQGIDAGADDFLTKPVDELELHTRITAMLRIRALTRDLEEKTRTLSRIASMDALTGIGNRRAFDERLATEIREAKKNIDDLAVILIDLDHFKSVNDRFGHNVGDDVLRMFGRLLAQTTRAYDLPFRYGGEEFVILCKGSDAHRASHLAERIRSTFELRSTDATSAGPQTCSLGVAGLQAVDASTTADQLVAAADAALYRAKDGGRNCVCKYDPRFDDKAA